MPEDKLQLNKKIEEAERLAEQSERAKEEIKEGVERLEKEVAPEKEMVSTLEKTTEARPPKEKIGEFGKITATAIPPVQQQRVKKIERALEEGLNDIYAGMSPDRQKTFKIVGEQTAKQINQLLNQTKVKAKKIIELIKKWLSLIPGVNKFFLEQEAKIKADKIIKMKE